MEDIDMNALFRLTWAQQILGVLLAEYIMNRIEADPTMVYKDCYILLIMPAVLFANAAWKLHNERQAKHYAMGIYVAVFVYIVNAYILNAYFEQGKVLLYIVEGVVVAALGVWITRGEEYNSG